MNKNELFYDLAIKRSDEQENLRKHYDIMGSGALALGGALIGVFAFAIKETTLIGWSIFPAALALFSFVILAITCWFVLRPRVWQVCPSLEELDKYIKEPQYTDDVMILWTGKAIMQVIPGNLKTLNTKARLLRVVYVCLASQSFFLGLYVTSLFY